MAPQARYRLVRTLGAGGMALVYEAVAVGDRGFERRVAIKRIRPDQASDDAMRRMFLDEARIASALHHGNIVQVLDFGTLDGSELLVMEHVDGLDARAAVRRSLAAGIAIEPGVALHITAEIAHALAHLDRSGVVHRDVSPQNVLLSWEGDVKLSDFGVALAPLREERTATGIVKGKPRYMAPEQARGLEVGARADVFALGATLHELLTGEPPGDDLGALCDAGLPEEVEHLAWVMLRPEPNERPDAAEVATAAGRLAATLLERGGRDRLVAWLARVRAIERPPPSKLDDVMGLCLVPAGDASERRFTVSRSAPEPNAEPADDHGAAKRSPPIDGVETVNLRRPVAAPVVAGGAGGVERRSPTGSGARWRGWLVAVAIVSVVFGLGTAAALVAPHLTRDSAGVTSANASPGTSRGPTPSPIEPAPAGAAWLRVAGMQLRGSNVEVDGRHVGEAPVVVALSVGSHRVVVTPEGASEPLLDRVVVLQSHHTQESPLNVSLRGTR